MKLTESLIVTSVHALCFKDGKVLLAQIKNRGFNYPGGHVEIGEKVEEAILRETYEEGYVKGTIKYIGSIEVSHKENLSFDSNGKYPLIAYQAFLEWMLPSVYLFSENMNHLIEFGSNPLKYHL